MRLARVTGRVWATLKRSDMDGLRLVTVQPLDGRGEEAGEGFVAYDPLGAGLDQLVLVVEGEPARHLITDHQSPPIDAGIVGLIDSASTR